MNIRPIKPTTAVLLASITLLTACSQTYIADDNDQKPQTDVEVADTDEEESLDDREIDFSFAVFADSHADEEYYPALLELAVSDTPDFLIHLGDLTRVGGEDELKAAKKLLDDTGLLYYVIPGDHDIVAAEGTSAFRSVFGYDQTSFDHGGYDFILIDNSDPSVSFGSEVWQWLGSGILDERPAFIFMHYPIEHPLLNLHTMHEEEAGAEDARRLLELLAGHDIRQIFAGEMHSYMRYTIGDSDLELTILGAAGPYNNPSSPQYLLVMVYNDGALDLTTRTLED